MHWPLNFSSSVKSRWLIARQEGQASKDVVSDGALLFAMALMSSCSFWLPSEVSLRIGEKRDTSISILTASRFRNQGGGRCCSFQCTVSKTHLPSGLMDVAQVTCTPHRPVTGHNYEIEVKNKNSAA